MANNSPTALFKGSGKNSDSADKKNEEQKAEPLNAESTEPQRDATAQAAADLELEQSRGTTFGDITSSNGDSNTRGLHGRDGGVVPEGVSNPVASEKAMEPDAPEAAEEGTVEAAKTS